MSSSHKNFMSEDAQALLVNLGLNIETARVRRSLKISTVCTRAGITGQTYQRLKKGDGGISLAVLINVLNALNIEDTLSLVAAPEQDHIGLALERSAAPTRIRKEGEGDDKKLDPNW